MNVVGMLYLSAYVGIWLLLQHSALRSCRYFVRFILKYFSFNFRCYCKWYYSQFFLLQLVCRSTVDFCMFIPFATIEVRIIQHWDWPFPLLVSREGLTTPSGHSWSWCPLGGHETYRQTNKSSKLEGRSGWIIGVFGRLTNKRKLILSMFP